jgi:hypothetical protein
MDNEMVTAKLAKILVDYQDPAQDSVDIIDPDIKPLGGRPRINPALLVRHFLPALIN